MEPDEDAGKDPGPPEDAERPDFFAGLDPPPIPEVLREPDGHPGKSPQPVYTDTTRAWGIAGDFVFTVLGALLLGYFADRWQGTSPRWTVVGLIIGFSVALWRIIRRTLADERRERREREERAGRGPGPGRGSP